MNFGFNFGFGGNKGIKALINYLSSGGIFKYTTSLNGNTILKNNGSGGMIYDAQTYTGRALQLGATNELAIPIFHTLGADTKQAAGVGTGWTANGNHSYTGNNTSSNLGNISTLTLYSSMTLEITFEITAITAGTVEGKNAIGTYTIYKPAETITCASFSGTIIIKSVKQINNDNSFLTYTDIATNKIVHLGNSVDNTGNTPELVENYNTVPSSATWTSGTITNLPDGFTKLDYGSNVNSYFYFRETNPEFKENLVAGKSYRAIGEFKTDGTNAYPGVAGQGLATTPSSAANGVVPFDVTFKATSASNVYISCYCDSATNRVIYWKLTSVNEVLSLAPTYNFLNQTVNNILTTHAEFSTSDLTKLQANPNLLAKLAMNGSAEELDMVLTGDEGWYPCAEETRALVFDAKSKSNGSFYFRSSKATTQTYKLKMPVGTSVTLNGVVYNGNGTTEVVATTIGKGVKFTESVDGALTYLKVNSNGLTGLIPNLSANTLLNTFDCYSNQVTGSIPSLSANTALVTFSCSYNQVTGSIPSLSANTALVTFYCEYNQLTGSIPSLSANTALVTFSCSYNQLTGSIPSLSANTALGNFYCIGNQLTGFAGGNIKVTTTFNASNNKLTVAAINSILQGLVDGGTTGAVAITLNGGTNGIPTNTTAIDTLRARGCTVIVNT